MSSGRDERDRRVDGDLEIVRRDVAAGAFEFHGRAWVLGLLELKGLQRH